MSQPADWVWSLRRCGPGDALALRRLRLAMLADSPRAYDVDLAEVAARPTGWWEGFAGESSGEVRGPVPRTAVLAKVDGHGVAMVAAHLDESVVHAGALWVAPRWRGCGVATALIGTVDGWAHDMGAARVELGVSEVNAAAVQLYTALGFAPTGERLATRWGTCEVVLSRPVAA